MEWPGYTRITHEPVPGAIKVHESINIVFVEGNYLLVDRGPFVGIPSIFDLRIYVDGPLHEDIVEPDGSAHSRRENGG